MSRGNGDYSMVIATRVGERMIEGVELPENMLRSLAEEAAVRKLSASQFALQIIAVVVKDDLFKALDI